MWREPRSRIVGRRLVTLPALLVLTVCTTALLPIALVAAGAHDLLRKRDWVSVRCLLVVVGNFWFHVVGVIALVGIWLTAGRWTGAAMERRSRWILGFESWWARLAFGIARRLFRMRVEIQGVERAAPGPILLFVRHTSILDTLLPVIHVAHPHRMHLRFVMKRELLRDPCVDIFGHNEPTAFVRRGTRTHAPEIAAVRHLLEDLREHDGVVLFPEGTRFTAEKRAQVLRSLRRKDPAAFERARTLRHVLPPRIGGALALLEHHDADVVFFAHTGLEGATKLRHFLDGMLLDARVVGQLWRIPHASIPRDREAQIDWLWTWWHRVDDWIDAHRIGLASR
jgi:1-acyl-sn-glycerol-3-phosphate acyltransferase